MNKVENRIIAMNPNQTSEMSQQDVSLSHLTHTERSASRDYRDGSSLHPQEHTVYRPVAKPSPRAYPGQHHHTPSHRSSFPPSRPSHQLHAVVTSSFSVDDERDDYYPGARGPSTGRPTNRIYNVNHNQTFTRSLHPEDRWPNGERQRDVQERVLEERIPPPCDGPRPVMIPPSPPEATTGDHLVETTRPSGYAVSRPEVLKRSFWHHSRPSDENDTTCIHPAFAPPKRMKHSGGSKKQLPTLTPTGTRLDEAHDDRARWYTRTHSWGAHEQDPIYRHVRKSQSFPSSWGDTSAKQPGSYEAHDIANQDVGSPHWGATRVEPGERSNVFSPPHSEGANHSHYSHGQPPQAHSHRPSREGSFDRGWAQLHEPSPWRPPSPPPHYPDGRRSWGSPLLSLENQSRDDAEAPTRASRAYPLDPRHGMHFAAETPVRRQVTFDSSGGEPESMRHHLVHHVLTPPQQKIGALRQEEQYRRAAAYNGREYSGPGLRGSFSRTRDGTETQLQSSDVALCLLAQPEDRISLSETLCTIRENIEVFTATTRDVEAPAPGRKHPVVVGQVGLRCIHCRHTTKSSDRVKRAVCYPSSIKRIYRTVIDMKLDHFQHCRFVPTALRERLDELKAINTRSTGTTMQYFVKAAMKMGMVDGESGVRFAEVPQAIENSPLPVKNEVSPASSYDFSKRAAVSRSEVTTESEGIATPEKEATSPDRNSNQVYQSLGPPFPDVSSFPRSTQDDDKNNSEFTGRIILALPEDKMALSPLRCFLRQNVCAFSATEEDIAVRTPTTFSVVLGQVGIGCIHCHSLPAKERSNRAVCFPFSISRIYQSVADIQRFHLGECKMVPPEVRLRFLSLQSASSKGSKGLATRQYWVTSARKIGLVDTEGGIRFGRDPSIQSAPAVSLDILAQVASNVTTASKPLVLPEDKGCIAEFLYVVMEQLQPCRFTEADRNKRRLKDVGCIGVECKHCAGQVESRKFFWSSVNAVESNFVSVHTHMMSCEFVPDALKAHLAELKRLRKEQTGRLKTGSQKAFFARVWDRLHGEDEPATSACSNETTIVEPSKSEKPSRVDGVSSGIKQMTVVSV